MKWKCFSEPADLYWKQVSKYIWALPYHFLMLNPNQNVKGQGGIENLLDIFGLDGIQTEFSCMTVCGVTVLYIAKCKHITIYKWKKLKQFYWTENSAISQLLSLWWEIAMFFAVNQCSYFTFLCKTLLQNLWIRPLIFIGLSSLTFAGSYFNCADVTLLQWGCIWLDLLGKNGDTIIFFNTVARGISNIVILCSL